MDTWGYFTLLITGFPGSTLCLWRKFVPPVFTGREAGLHDPRVTQVEIPWVARVVNSHLLTSILKTGVLIRRDAHGIRGMFYYLLLSFIIFFIFFIFFLFFIIFLLCFIIFYYFIFFLWIGQYIFCIRGPNFRVLYWIFIFGYLFFWNWAIHFLWWWSKFQEMFSFSDFLFFCIGQYIVCIGGPNFKIFFVSFMYSWFLYCVYNIFFCIGIQISGYVFLCFFIFCFRQYIFCIGGPKFRIFVFILFYFLLFFLFFVFGNTFFVLGVQISGYFFFFYFFLIFSIFFYFFLFFSIFFSFLYFLYLAIHFLYWGSKFQDIFFIFFKFLLFFFIFCIRQYTFYNGGPSFRIFFLYFFDSAIPFLSWGSKFQDMFVLFFHLFIY